MVTLYGYNYGSSSTVSVRLAMPLVSTLDWREYLTVGLEIHVLLLDHVIEVQLFSLTLQIKLLFSPHMALDRQPSMYFSLVATPCTVTSL